MKLTCEEILSINGGEQPLGDVPAWFPNSIVTSAVAFLKNVGRMPWPYTPANSCFQPPTLEAYLVRSTRLEARVQPDQAGTHVITIPMGLLARVWVVARLLLTFWEDRYRVAFLNSPFDDFDPDLVFIPPRYLPLFGEVDNDERFWNALRELNASIPDVSPDDVNVMTLFVLYFVVFHEMHHAHFRHSEIIRCLKRTGQTGQLDELWRGFELQADEFASRHVLRILMNSLQQSGYGVVNEYQNLFIRLSYAVTLYLGMMNPTWKYIHRYRRGAYAHPTIRHQVFAIATSTSLKTEDRSLQELWRDVELEGWLRCVRAYMDLSFDIMLKHESEKPPGMIMQPVQDLMHGGLWSAQQLKQLAEEEFAHMARATDLNYRYLTTKQL